MVKVLELMAKTQKSLLKIPLPVALPLAVPLNHKLTINK
jgi:hypothetical protein